MPRHEIKLVVEFDDPEVDEQEAAQVVDLALRAGCNVARKNIQKAQELGDPDYVDFVGDRISVLATKVMVCDVSPVYAPVRWTEPVPPQNNRQFWLIVTSLFLFGFGLDVFLAHWCGRNLMPVEFSRAMVLVFWGLLNYWFFFKPNHPQGVME